MKFKERIPTEVSCLIERLEAEGFDSYLVGGSVRDLALGLIPSDWDITTSALPEEVIEIFGEKNVKPTGIEFGTVTVLIRGGGAYEVTTFRGDGIYKDGRRPSSVVFEQDVMLDLSRRDFTINAMAYNPRVGLVDPYGGMRDLVMQEINCVGDPFERFREDALRIMRALRFTSTYGFRIGEETRLAIESEYRNINLYVSVERIFKELIGILGGNFVANVLKDYDYVLKDLIPELVVMDGYLQENPYHSFDVLEHTKRVVQYVEGDGYLRLAALFHDLGKPYTKSYGEDGIAHFYGHEKVSAQLTLKILEHFKVSSKVRDYIVALVLNHDAEFSSKRVIKRLVGKYGFDLVEDLLVLRRADILGQSVYKFHEKFAVLDKAYEYLEYLRDTKTCLKMSDLAINGNDLKRLGFSQGRELGYVLRLLFEEVLAELLENDYESLTVRALELLEEEVDGY